jgi:PIN domain nuclease of toxin-antitoxin system
MIQAVTDTHAVIWYLFGDSRLSSTARATFTDAATTGNQIAFSTITLIEIIYLIERGRIDSTAFDRVLAALTIPDTVLAEAPVNQGIATALRSVDRHQVPDLPDRIITATALNFGVPLISRDRAIQAGTVTTIW